MRGQVLRRVSSFKSCSESHDVASVLQNVAYVEIIKRRVYYIEIKKEKEKNCNTPFKAVSYNLKVVSSLP